MIITLKELGYQLRPYSKGPCWQLYRLTTERRDRAGNPLPDEWLPIESYPSTLESGLRSIAERSIREIDSHGSLTDAIGEVARVFECLRLAVEGPQPDE